MTCIVGMEYQGSVILAGDIQGTGWNSKVVHTQPKVFALGGVGFGYTTSYRFGQIIEHAMKAPVVPDAKDQVYRWLITVLIPDIAEALKKANFEGGGNCLIGVKGQLWELQPDFSVIRSTLGYAAVGSGTEYALGSMFNAAPKSSRAAVATVRNAVRCAGTFCPSVGTDSEFIIC
jgi:ATP-dependent protease HslVU (ClpYQ) peptidase subunit